MSLHDLISQLEVKRESLIALLNVSSNTEKIKATLCKIDEKLDQLKKSTLTQSSITETSTTHIPEQTESSNVPEQTQSDTISDSQQVNDFNVGHRCIVSYKDKEEEAVVVKREDDAVTIRLVEVALPHPVSPLLSVNDLVLARYSSDKKFYPAKITSSFDPSTESYLVEYLSYDVAEKVKAEFIRPIPEDQKTTALQLTLSAGDKRQRAFEEREVKRKKREDEIDKIQNKKFEKWSKFQSKTSTGQNSHRILGKSSAAISGFTRIQKRQNLRPK
ncbi:hypothetical protein GEMRC1_008216 [Eukaryota sp. GEM-RC1]